MLEELAANNSNKKDSAKLRLNSDIYVCVCVYLHLY